MTKPLPLVLIICTANSCRSQMAEAFLQAAAKGRFQVASAGSKPAGYIHPVAVKVMREVGIDISANRSKHLSEFLDRPVETVITVCGNADEACPIFPGQMNRYYWGFADPVQAPGAEDEKLDAFRQIRDQIRTVFEAYAAGRGDALQTASVSR